MSFHSGGWRAYIRYDEEHDRPTVSRTLLRRVAAYAHPYWGRAALMIGLIVLSLGVAALLGSDIIFAFRSNLEIGVIKSLGSLLILWMMIELLHTQVHQLKGGKFNVRIFVDLAMVAFIRKVFVATIEYKDPLSFGLLLAGLLILGVIYFFVTRAGGRS